MKYIFYRNSNVLKMFLLLTAAGILLIHSIVTAQVTKVDITSRQTVSGGLADSPAGPYEVIKGVMHLEVAPDNPANKRIVDLKLAKRNSRGNVGFFTDFELHKPVDAGRGNHRLLYFVNNRGNKMGEYHFNHQARNWLKKQGWSYLWCGWNCDVKENPRKLNIKVPVVTNNGKTITGKIYSEMISYSDDITYSHRIVRDNSVVYPPVSMNNSNAVLTKRQYRWEEPVKIPNSQWSYARFVNGKAVPDPGFLYIKEGFAPGWLYDLVYEGKDPQVTGLGMAAVRDVVSFIKYEKADKNGFDNPLAGVIDYAYAWGHSQSARFLYHYVYQNFNGDEKNRKVLDGIYANCAGSGKGLFNSRFAQTTRHGSHHECNLFPIDIFPFNTVEQYDPVTKERGDGFALARKSGFLPKMFFLNTNTDYWTRAASLLHTDVEGKKDAAIDPEARIYFVAGRTHLDSRVGIIGRALLTALDLWVSRNVEPPDSEIPKISDGSLVTLKEYMKKFPEIPGLLRTDSYYKPYRLDLGPRWNSEGIADNVPPKTGPQYEALVPQVKKDGNEIAGIKLPEIAVPFATFTGWKMRNPSFSHTLGINSGKIIPFPRTAEEGKKNNDPRKPVFELYPTKSDYIKKITESLRDLKRKRFILEKDYDNLLIQAGEQYDLAGNSKRIEDMAIEEGAESAVKYFTALRKADFLWWLGLSSGQIGNGLNSKGYELMQVNRLEAALEVFKVNTKLYSRNANVWDSLAECYYNMKKYDLAVKNYEKSIRMNPNNENGKNMLDRIKKERGK